MFGPVTYNALRSQKTARAEATNNAPRSQMSSVAGDTEFFSLFEDELGGTRPDRLYEVRPQERDQRHTVEQIVDTLLSVPSLDVPVPQMGNQLGGRMSAFRCPHSRAGYRSAQDFAYPPSSSQAPVCASLSRRQTSWWKYRRSSPILYSGLWSRTSTFQFLVVEGQQVGLQGFLPRQRSTAVHASLERSSERIVEQIVDSRVLGGGFSASSTSSREHAGEGFFSDFSPDQKKSEVGFALGVGTAPRVEPIHAEALIKWLLDERTSMVDANGHAWVRLDTARGTFWQNLDTGHQHHGNTEVPQIQFIDYVVLEAELEYIIMRQSTEAFGFVCSFGLLAALRTWKKVHYSPDPCIWQPFLGVWVLLMDYRTLDFSGDDFVRGAMLGLTVDAGLVTVLGFWKNFTYFLHRRWLGFWRFFSC